MQNHDFETRKKAANDRRLILIDPDRRTRFNRAAALLARMLLKLSPHAVAGQHQTHAWKRNVPSAFLYRFRSLAERSSTHSNTFEPSRRFRKTPRQLSRARQTRGIPNLDALYDPAT
jgi:hypothetical protein